VAQFKEERIMRIYVGNLSYDVTGEELRAEFAAFGKVDSAEVVTDRVSGRPKGFAFVEMPVASEAQAAITGLNGKTLKERALTVTEARPKSDNRGGAYRRGRSGGGFDGGRSRRY
jgi:cold-inducible RNA-binding protein